MKKKISLPLTGGKKMVAEINPDPDYKEIWIYLEDENGCVTQDLAVIGEKYSYTDEGVSPEEGYVLRVYADKDSEDYSDSFEVEEYIPPENKTM